MNVDTHRAICAALLIGLDIEQAAKETGASERTVRGRYAALTRAGVRVEPDADLTVDQAAVVLDVIPRRVRLLCSQGRLGRRMGERMFLIRARELADFILSRVNGETSRLDAVAADRKRHAELYSEGT